MSSEPLRRSPSPGAGVARGGAVRDRLLGRPTSDYDVALEGEPEQAAKALARRAGGHAFELSEQLGVWRVVVRDRGWQLDPRPLGGRSIEQDSRTAT